MALFISKAKKAEMVLRDECIPSFWERLRAWGSPFAGKFRDWKISAFGDNYIATKGPVEIWFGWMFTLECGSVRVLHGASGWTKLMICRALVAEHALRDRDRKRKERRDASEVIRILEDVNKM